MSAGGAKYLKLVLNLETRCVQVMYRERAAGMYSELPFASAQCLIEVPYNLIQTMFFSLISYFMLGFDHTAGEFDTLACPS
jgi:ABC-type multidrug transport system permease subunit